MALPPTHAINSRLLRWHASAGRHLSVRDSVAPWPVLVAEVMSQQTQIERVGPAWQRFVERWPTPSDLATATTYDLIAAWSGLGYNRRALALREAARSIVEDHAGLVPADVEALGRLPGVGPYTARAVAAIAFGVPVAPLDVNVRRVVGRLLGLAPTSPALQVAADGLVSRTDPRRWVNAVMDLAASVCTTRSPACPACPLSGACASRGTPGSVPAKRTPVPFPSTRRWLRGRLIATLAAAGHGVWLEAPPGLGEHDAVAVREVVLDLERDGFLELRGSAIRLRADHSGLRDARRGR